MRQEKIRSREIQRIEDVMLPYAYWLYTIPGIGSRTIHSLLSTGRTPYELYHMSGAQIEKCLPASANRQSISERIVNAQRNFDRNGAYEKLGERRIRFTCLGHGSYPERLAQIPDAPYALFFIGRLPEPGKPTAAIIGARDCSEYGRQMARLFGKELAEAGIGIISGMARGIDGIGQSAALTAGGYSLGVMGCGVDICYPAENRDLYSMLCAQGGICSEYLPGTQPKNSLFPPRNRIISGFSDIVLVIEAKGKSGTLITVDMALEQGKEVYALPGRVTEALSEGCNYLIKQGAGVAISPQDMIRELLGEESERRSSPVLLSAFQTDLLENLNEMPQSVEKIKEHMLLKCGYTVSVAELLNELFKLSVSGHVKQIGNSYFMKA